MFRFKKYICIVILCFVVNGCTEVHHGYYFSIKKEKVIEPGKTTRDQVLAVFGTPTFTNEPKNNMLFYANTDGESFLFVRELVEQRRIVAFVFNKEGTLTEARQYSLDDGKYVIMHNINVELARPNPLWAVPFYTLF